MFQSVDDAHQNDDSSIDRAIILDQVYPKLRNKLDVDETCQLAESAGVSVASVMSAVRNKPHPATFIGEGKIAELKDSIEQTHSNLVIVNHPITPIQERNLERSLQCQVLDRTRLILDIFAQRAQSHEGKLQVELAQLKHLSTRLVRGWSHLERQKGGIGLRGPGETQLETDRRLIAQRIKSLSRRLEGVEKQRELRRRARDRVPVPVITLVGYTNAGKSTLFNHMVNEHVFAADKLFATLDPTMRRLKIERFGDIILSDTVGFIQDLPHTLVAAFHSTLEEVEKSNILLHVIDYSNPDYLNHIDEVNKVLQEIGADTIPRINVFNKIDQLDESKVEARTNSEGEASVFISAQRDQGLNLLNDAIYDILTKNHSIYILTLEHDQEKFRSSVHSRCEVLEESYDDCGRSNLKLHLSPKHLGWLQKQCQNGISLKRSSL